MKKELLKKRSSFVKEKNSEYYSGRKYSEKLDCP
jgi:hypothetical protein